MAAEEVKKLIKIITKKFFPKLSKYLILLHCTNYPLKNFAHFHLKTLPEAEFKEFEPRLKYGSLHLKLY